MDLRKTIRKVKSMNVSIFEAWMEKFYALGNTNEASNVKESFLDLLDRMEFDENIWCLTKDSKPTDFWLYVISKYPVDRILEQLIHGILSIPFGSADSER